MEITKKVQLENNHSVWAYVYRDGKQVSFNHFEYIFTACFFPIRFHAKALDRCYKKANKWADSIIEVERKAERL